MDFTTFTMQDHFHAVVRERERQIENGAWRRKFEAARRENTAACCSVYEAATPSRPSPGRRPAAEGR
jgi:hypothetical protein